ncbi:ATP-binding cassette domain-containing protein [Embleya sp. NPDC050493]|uniref:ATP-binding cassette domain-containing protein n=1 Tax=Embleya sp. NPDC050493 TaxID=3363989 RepID=UPI0037B49BD5
MPLAISAEGVTKVHGATRALDGFDLEVPAGTVHGLLGPNGAGKTTAVRILTTLLGPDGGRAEVAGFDVVRDAARVRTRIGLLGQYAALDEVLGGRQNLEMFGRLYHLGARAARARAGELLERFALTDVAERAVTTYSGGMRRRLDLAASLIQAPEVLFLDEPTTGLDPRGRTEVWDAVRALVAGGTTVLLTTQYLEEADRLADTISVVDHGRVIARGTPAELKSRLGGDRIDVVVREPLDLTAAAAILARIGNGNPEVRHDERRVGIPITDRVGALTATVRALHDAGIEAEDIVLRRPTLDEVFLTITGVRRDGEPADDAGGSRRTRGAGTGDASEVAA